MNANLRQADLYKANLAGVDLRDAVAVEAMLMGANLSSINGLWTIFQNAELRQADLYRALLLEADLRGADLRKADLRQADLRNVDLSGAILTEAIYTPDTRWPEGFDAEKAGARIQY